MSSIADRILDITAGNASVRGEKSARIGYRGAGLMMAARAIARVAAVVTGNVIDFAPTGPASSIHSE